jgi:hypothetical protein
LSNTTIGVLMASMNSSIALIALPDIFRAIKMDPLLASNTVYDVTFAVGLVLVLVGIIYGVEPSSSSGCRESGSPSTVTALRRPPSGPAST